MNLSYRRRNFHKKSSVLCRKQSDQTDTYAHRMLHATSKKDGMTSYATPLTACGALHVQYCSCITKYQQCQISAISNG